jgi:hypothetical protein
VHTHLFLVRNQRKALEVFAFIEAITENLHLANASCHYMMRDVF